MSYALNLAARAAGSVASRSPVFSPRSFSHSVASHPGAIDMNRPALVRKTEPVATAIPEASPTQAIKHDESGFQDTSPEILKTDHTEQVIPQPAKPLIAEYPQEPGAEQSSAKTTEIKPQTTVSPVLKETIIERVPVNAPLSPTMESSPQIRPQTEITVKKESIEKPETSRQIDSKSDVKPTVKPRANQPEIEIQQSPALSAAERAVTSSPTKPGEEKTAPQTIERIVRESVSREVSHSVQPEGRGEIRPAIVVDPIAARPRLEPKPVEPVQVPPAVVRPAGQTIERRKVQVHIGTVEVEAKTPAATEPQPVAAPAPAPAGGFDSYSPIRGYYWQGWE